MLIYEPKGAAKEYGDYACNLYEGCIHACKYCYAPAVLRKNKTEFHSKCQPKKQVLERMEKELIKGIESKEVFLCFTSDPFQENNEDATLKAINLLYDYGKTANILTKNPKLAYNHKDVLIKCKSRIGSTIIFTDDAKSKYWEPNAPLVSERINYINKLAKYLNTWISLEPTIDTVQGLNVIECLKDVVDVIKIGKINHMRAETKQDWTKYIDSCIEIMLNCRKTKYYIKDDLWKYASEYAKRKGKTNIQ